MWFFYWQFSATHSSNPQAKWRVVNCQLKVAIASWKWGSPVKVGSPVQCGESPVQSGDRQFKVAIASSKWRSPVLSGDRQFKVANRQFKVAIASSKWRIASPKWRSPVQSGESPVQKYIIIPWPLMGTVVLVGVEPICFRLSIQGFPEVIWGTSCNWVTPLLIFGAKRKRKAFKRDKSSSRDFLAPSKT